MSALEEMRAFLKARASLDGADTWTWFTGTTHAWLPDGAWKPLFFFEGYNVARVLEAGDSGFDLLTREAVFYLDLATREPLEKWPNPFTGAAVEVLHIWNDPVNQQLRVDGPRPFRAPTTGIGEDVFFNADIFLAYPSPLPRTSFPDASQDDLYKAAELFQFFSKRRDIEDPSVLNAPAQVSWTRLGPWLPWMLMGDRPGMLVYHGRGAKLNRYEDLPAWIRDRVAAEHPEYATAPASFTAPNATSWTTYRAQRG